MLKRIFLILALSCLSAFGQVLQSTTTISQPADVQLNNGMAIPYRVTAGTGLTANVAAGSTMCVDQWVDYAGGTVAVTDNAVTYIVIDPAQNCAVVPVATLVQGQWWLAKVTASGGAILAGNAGIKYARMIPQFSKVAIPGGGGTGGGTNSSGTVAISGCGVAYTGGLSFTVSPCVYNIAGTQYSSPQASLTLAAADVTFERFDVIAVDNTSNAIVIQGTPSGTPAEPSVDPATQLRLIAVDIPAGATVPAGVTKTDLYLENTEWTCAASSNFNCASTSNPFAGTKDIEATSAVAGNNVVLTKPSSTVDLSTYANLILYIRSKAAWPNAKSLSLFWENGTAIVGASVAVKTGVCGFNSGVTGTYQQCVIPLGSFATGTNPVNKLKITVAGGAGSIGFYLDNISIQSGTQSGSSGPQTFTVTATSPLSGGGTAPLGGTVTMSCPTCGTGSGNVTGSSLTSGQLIKGNGGSAITVGDLSGDVTTSGGTATSVVKVNGASVPTSATALASNGSNQLVTATYQGNGTKVQLSTGTTTTNDCLKFDANGNVVDAGAPCGTGSGTVSSVATTSPITGGTITNTGTIACATCVTASSPGAGVAHFAGSTQAVTSSAVVGGDMTNNTVTSTQLAVVNTRRTCIIDNDTQSATALADAQITGRCDVPAASTLIEIDVYASGGTPTMLLERWRPNGGATADLQSGSLATASAGAFACAMSSISLSCISGLTSSGSITLSNTSLNAGDVIRVKNATAGGTATWHHIAAIYTIN